nr:hypothetical protein [Actinomycetota bacterium]
PPAAVPAAPPTLAALCQRHVTYWAGRALSGGPDAGLDYQEMGLVAGEYAILSEVVHAHRGGQALSAAEGRLVAARCAGRFGTATRLSPQPGPGWPG